MVKARKKHDIIKAKGTARYAHLNEPNKRFDEYGVYSCDLIVDRRNQTRNRREVKAYL